MRQLLQDRWLKASHLAEALAGEEPLRTQFGSAIPTEYAAVHAAPQYAAPRQTAPNHAESVRWAGQTPEPNDAKEGGELVQETERTHFAEAGDGAVLQIELVQRRACAKQRNG